MLYDPRYHPNHRENAHCTHCFADISIKGRTTSGLKRHLQSRHREQFESINDTASTSSETTGQQSISHLFSKAKNMNDIHTKYVHAVTNFIIAESQPFTIVASPEFRGLFRPFHKEANKITEVSSYQLREEIFTLRLIAKKATKLEVDVQKGSWTTDHWTGCNDATYTTTTFHYIKQWSLRNIIVDFKVFHGTTSGEAIYKDQAAVLAEYTKKENIVIGITDTTGSMGVLGQHLHNNGMEHAYCTDHNLHCNAILAFAGEYQTPH